MSIYSVTVTAKAVIDTFREHGFTLRDSSAWDWRALRPLIAVEIRVPNQLLGSGEPFRAMRSQEPSGPTCQMAWHRSETDLEAVDETGVLIVEVSTPPFVGVFLEIPISAAK
jgi:hypothetical protein